jgi:hypothetical protein
MRLSPEWLVAKKVLIAVAIAAVMAIANWQILHTGPEIYATVSAVVAGVFALGAMRDPWFFLAVAVLTSFACPRVFDSSAHEMFQASYQGGWLLGAIAGKVIRMVRAGRADVPEPVSSK